ncbi:MAG: imidazole glycerol phosphate synthase subunit HisH [Thermoproteota archaeon]|jgi:imidazole glycerol-phosphate synthase subunit HisH|nr:imidazole glycerol phosphate synthase subunit HisH [Thermoproteota archaeon]MDP9493338.1 imidazole glycerol phosphate synthase subunit HisH [Thermoproteota archaeon]
MTKIAIFDFGAGNLFNLHQSLLGNGAHSVDIIRSLRELENYDGLVLPGVGNFDSAISSMQKDSALMNTAVDKDMPILGICLGLEMLFDKSEEGILEGLKILDGDVLMLPKIKVKVPHIGWNNLRIVNTGSNLLKGIPQDSWVYFVHSYHIEPQDDKLIAAVTEYGSKLPVVIERSNLFGTQFHPEKSGKIGAQIMKNFVNICEKNE